MSLPRRFPIHCFFALISNAAAEAQEKSANQVVDKVRSHRLEKASAGDGIKLFSRLEGGEIGLGFVSQFEVDHPLGYQYRSGFAAAGLAVGDVDGDGWPDVFFAGTAGPDGLYRNSGTPGELKFEEVTGESPGLDGGGSWSAGVAMADVDNDGDLDIYVCRFDTPNALWINRGDGTFEEKSSEWGAGIIAPSHTPAFCDYDNDGDLDLYIATYRYDDPKGYRGAEAVGMRNGRPALRPGFERWYEVWYQDEDHWGVHSHGQEDYLLRNDGGRFTDVTSEAGISGRGDGLAATWWDYDGDGDSDLYVSNDFISPDRLYQNNGDGTFTNVAGEVIPHTAWFSMGADAGDLNGDGFPDLMSADMSATNHFKQKTTMGVMGGNILRRALESKPTQLMRNALLVNTGTGRFLEAAELAGLASSDWTWAVKLWDFDGDGRRDVFFTNGTALEVQNSDRTLTPAQLKVKSEWEYVKTYPPRREENLAFKNLGDLEFEDTSVEWGLNEDGVSYGAAVGDFDRDGDPDLIVLEMGKEALFFRNDRKGGSRVAIALRGQKSNRLGTGAHLTLDAGGQRQVFELQPDRGFMSGDEPAVLAALGDAKKIDRLEIRWPGRGLQVLENLPAGFRYEIQEAAGLDAIPAKTSGEPLLTSADGLPLGKHTESVADDFAKQPLLPNRLSGLGGGIAWGDVNGDGLDDVFLGGASGYPGELRLNRGGGKFSAEWVNAFRGHAASEDMGALFFDVDSDGDLDLYVASGSYEFASDDPLLRDRLYVNTDGKGSFEAAPAAALPNLLAASGPVCGADFDRDGDVDLFVGGRVVPGAYPSSPRSVLLRNVSAGGVPKFEVVSGIDKIGMITSAVWTDIDADGWVDLAVATEWGAVQIFKNSEGELTDATESLGLSKVTGWWNSLAAGDFDHDGDIDLVAGNIGLNTKYHATTEKPVRLFYGDYHGTGKPSIVEAEYEAGLLYPVRGKSCSTQAMPALGKKFTTFRGFAKATLPEIYGNNQLSRAKEFAANTLESCVLINQGDKGFKVLPLPRLAQISPIFGVLVRDIDLDGHSDIICLQNFFGPQNETGPFDGGVGHVLPGKGDGTFGVLGVADSGLAISGDGSALASTDADGDGRYDFAAGQNNAEFKLLSVALRSDRSSVAVRLVGPKGNPTAAGARLVLKSGGVSQVAEITAGDSYLSQSGPVMIFGIRGEGVIELAVTWPDGHNTSHQLNAGSNLVTYPKSP